MVRPTAESGRSATERSAEGVGVEDRLALAASSEHQQRAAVRGEHCDVAQAPDSDELVEQLESGGRAMIVITDCQWAPWAVVRRMVGGSVGGPSGLGRRNHRRLRRRDRRSSQAEPWMVGGSVGGIVGARLRSRGRNRRRPVGGPWRDRRGSVGGAVARLSAARPEEPGGPPELGGRDRRRQRGRSGGRPRQSGDGRSPCIGDGLTVRNARLPRFGVATHRRFDGVGDRGIGRASRHDRRRSRTRR